MKMWFCGFHFAVLFAASLNAEEPYRIVESAGNLPAHMAKEDFKRGQLDEHGKLVFLTLHHPRKGARNIAMNGGSGAMIFFEKSSGEESYEFYSKKDRKILRSSTLEEFLKLVRTMPRGSELTLFNLCLAGTHKGYPRKNWDRIAETCQAEGVVFDRLKPVIVCNCESAE
jgi:hypothetical protein